MSKPNIIRHVKYTATLGTGSYRPYVSMDIYGTLNVERSGKEVTLLPSEVIELYRFIQEVHPDFERKEGEAP